MPTLIRFADGQSPVEFEEDYDRIRNHLIDNRGEPVELHSKGSPMLVFPQSIVAAFPKGESRTAPITVIEA